MAEEKLDRPEVELLGQPATCGLVTQVVPLQIDLRELVAIDSVP